MNKTIDQLQMEIAQMQARQQEYLNLLASALRNGPKDESWRTGVSYALTNAFGKFNEGSAVR